MGRYCRIHLRSGDESVNLSLTIGASQGDSDLVSQTLPFRRSDSIRSARTGFTLVDALVTVAIVAVLISILLPSLSGVRETARRVVCASNARQIGLGITMYADDSHDRLPPSVFLPETAGQGFAESEANPAEMMTMRLGAAAAWSRDVAWDGVGLLYSAGYLNAPKLFYCPSHHGENPYSRYAAAWMNPDRQTLVSNYQYRGEGANGEVFMSRIEPASTILLSDGLRTVADYNHRTGMNIFRADTATLWVNDSGGLLSGNMSKNDQEVADKSKVPHLWDLLDRLQTSGIVSSDPR